MHQKNKSLLWVYYGSLRKAMSSATWVSTANELTNLGWSVTIIAQDLPDGNTSHIRLYPIHKTGYYLLGYLKYYLAVAQYVFKNAKEFDIILFHQHSAPIILFVRMLLHLFGETTPKFIMDVRSLPMLVTRLSEKAWVLFFKFSQKLANRFADGITAITPSIVDAAGINRTILMGIWPSGVNTIDFQNSSSQHSWPENDDALCFIYIGALHKDRHLLEFCQAITMANQNGYAVHLSIVGNGSFETELKNFANQAKNLISVHPRVPHTDIPNLLAGAHIGILPFPDDIKYHVSSPIKLFEYMAAGMPVLATRINCHTSVINDDFVFWAEDASIQGLYKAIETACLRKLELQAMSPKAAQTSLNWTWEKSAMKLNSALEKALNR